MKNLFKKSLLVLIGVLITSLTTQVLAYNWTGSCTVYFDNSQWNWDDVKLYIWKDGGASNTTWTGQQVAGSSYYKFEVSKWDNFTGFKFYTGSWTHETNELHDELNSSWYTLCFSGDDNQNWTLVGPKNVGIENTTTTYGGDGLSSETPFIVEAGKAITCNALGAVIDGNTSLRYSFNTGSGYGDYGTSASYTVASTPAHNETFQVKVKVKTIRDSYNSREFETATIYYKAINIHTGLSASATPTAAASAGYPTISANYVTAGNTVDVVAGSAQTGYTWSTWSSANGTFGSATSASTTFQPSADDAEAVANFTENMSSITINAATTPSGTGGSVTTGAGTNISLGIATGRAVVASDANTNYYFTGWTVDGHAVVDAPSSKSTTVRTDGYDGGTGIATATYASRYAIAGSQNGGGDSYGIEVNGTPGWGYGYPMTLDYDADNSDYRRVLTLKGNTSYKFKVWDKKEEKYYGVSTAAVTIEGDDKWFSTGSYDATFTLNGSDDIIFKIKSNGGDHVELHIQTIDGKHTYNTATYYSQTFKGDGTYTTSTTGGTVTAVDGKGFTFAPGNKVKTGGSVTFTAAANANYTFIGWYTNAACTTAYDGDDLDVTIDGATLTLSSIAANKTVYAKFAENMCAVTLAHTGRGHIEIGGSTVTSTTAGVVTSRTITAVPDAGYYFAGWTVSDGADCSVASTAGRDDNESSSTTLTGLGAGTTGTVTAKFIECEKIYFYNYSHSDTWNKDHIYVYFNVGWNHEGVSQDAVATTSYFAEMTDPYGSDTYEAYVPRAVTVNNYTAVAFSNVWMGSSDYPSGLNSHFYQNAGVYRTDYNQKLNEYILNSTSSGTSNSTVYYNDGYWRQRWTEGSKGVGYYLLTSASDTVAEFKANSDNASFSEVTVRLDNTSDKTYYIVSEGGIYYKTVDASGTDKNVQVDNYSNYLKDVGTTATSFTLKPSAEGQYTFQLQQLEQKMRLEVSYPASPGDYRVAHSYTIRNKADDADSTVYTYSDVIKMRSAKSKLHKYSMYLSKGSTGTSTLDVEKCTGINGTTKQPEWASCDASGLAPVLDTLNKYGNNVYQFNLGVETAAGTNQHKVWYLPKDSICLYKGHYYIKTDSTEGGWAAYKYNPMARNMTTFSKTDSSTYDNYYCHYYYTSGGNIKCVIANDYCNQLSDTLKGDGVATLSGTEPVANAKTSIRFSYNSATNQVKRTYLGASTENDYLDILVSTDDKVYKEDGTTDLYDNRNTPLQCRFEDQKDWVYEKIVKVLPGGKGGVTATYNGKTQVLVPETNILIGGTTKTEPATKYNVRLLYDFKTNYIMTAWIPGGPVNDALSDLDMVWERQADKSAAQITFGANGSLSNVKVVGAIRFDYDTVHHMGSGDHHVGILPGGYGWTSTTRRHLKYFVSFPFDVPVASVFGLAEAQLGREYDIQKYNGEKRAKDGLFYGDGDNYWENMTEDEVMKANEGYCVIFDNDYIAGYLGHIWDNKGAGSSVYLYFPGTATIESITNENCTTKVAAHTCTIDRAWTNNTKKNHLNTDSHWNVIGSPLFHDSYIKDTLGADTFMLRSFYYLDITGDNTWKSKAVAEDRLFKAMSCKFVQWCGTIRWTTSDPGAWGLYSAPRRTTEEDKKNYFMKLELTYNGKTSDWTYVELNEGADTAFVLREDMCKYTNKGIPQIYTFAGGYDVAYNTSSLESQTIPVGVIIRKNGTYTFSMPTNFSGTVTLIDKFAQTRTNLGLEDYTVDLQKGTIDDRFELEFNVQNAPTAIDGVTDGSGTLKDGKAHKYIENNQMYILQNGVIYDARGNRVK